MFAADFLAIRRQVYYADERIVPLDHEDSNHRLCEEELWSKVPTADLLDGSPLQPDEVELGLSYDQIDDYLEGRIVPAASAERIETLWRRSRHKRTTPVGPADDWWR